MTTPRGSWPCRNFWKWLAVVFLVVIRRSTRCLQYSSSYVTFRAYTTSSARSGVINNQDGNSACLSLLENHLQQCRDVVLNYHVVKNDDTSHSCLEFSIRPEDMRMIYSLPANMVSIVVGPLERFCVLISSQSSRQLVRKEDVQVALGLWQELGNKLPPHFSNASQSGSNGTAAETTMSISSTSENNKNYFGVKKNVSDTIESYHELRMAVAHELSSLFGWKISADRQSNIKDSIHVPSCSTIAFRLETPLSTSVNQTNDQKSSTTSPVLELVALVRLRPLRDDHSYQDNVDTSKENYPSSNNNKNRKKSQSYRRGKTAKLATTKRIESFAVAKTADIQPHEVVLDPLCKRGTLLVEAAKYRPNADYFGMDTNLGHLEHVVMNARSCGIVPLQLQHCSDSVLEKPLSPLKIKRNMVDKLMTCLPFGKTSTAFYIKLLARWSLLMKENGKLVLVIDSLTLNTLLEAVHALQKTQPNAASSGLVVSFVRRPFFQWGRQRATIVILTKTNLQNSEDRTFNDTGILCWEEESILDVVTGEESLQVARDPRTTWAKLRRSTLPHLASYSKAQQVYYPDFFMTAPTSILLPNGKVWRGKSTKK
mmetsp:Transcript_30852/g.51261  ORF Transcript_30852/g.51261 Transcript_30852/m.51261 type:complete len:597 (+) Transcript_30852:3-1793(+)